VNNHEITLTDRDGSRRICSITASLFRDEGGQPLKIVGSMRDVTDRKISDEMRSQSDVQFRNIVEESPMGIHMYDLRDDGRLIFTGGNPAAERIVGVDNAQFIDKSIEEAFPPLAETEVPERYRRAAARGETWHAEQLNYEDERITGGFEVHAFQTSPGKMAAMFHDITERKLGEVERRRLQEQLLHSQKMESIGTLAGGIAHDFNNILGAILGYTELALDDLSDEVLLRDYLGEVLNAGLRAKNIVKQILAFSRKVDESRQHVDVSRLLDEVVKLLRPSIPTTIDVRRTVEGGCGSVFADANQLHQVVMNLCTNASYAMRKEGGVLTLGCEAVTVDRHSDFVPQGLPDGSYVKITVGDTGAGMSREVRSRIFEPYFTTKPTGEGSGLGLAVALGIVEGHGGKIAVRSEPGKGSSFSLYLPKIDVDVSARSEKAELPPGDERVLLVDDDPSLVRLGTRMLEKLGYRVTAFTSSVEALRTLSGDPDGFDVVITDQTMPDLTGSALAKEILALRSELPVVISTGHSDILDEKEARRIGVKALLMKPFNHEKLARTLRGVLDGAPFIGG
jgi:PAS domain S-box-containing protein